MSIIQAADGQPTVDMSPDQIEQMVRDAFRVGFAAAKTSRPDGGFTPDGIRSYLQTEGEEIPDQALVMILAVVADADSEGQSLQ